MEQQYLSPKSLKHFICDDLAWYNLDTSRKVKNLKNRIPVESPRITATNIDTLYAFILLNGLSIGDLKAPKTTIDKLKELEKQYKKLPNHLSKCDIDSIDPQKLSNLPEFSFSQMRLRGIITNVVDGDTVDAALSIPMDQLMYASGSQASIVIGKGHQKFIIKLRLRLYGIDTAEKDTIEGQLAKKYSIDLYQKTQDRVEVLILGTGARGRNLALLYPRSGRKSKVEKSAKSINDLILHYQPKDTQVGEKSITLGKLAIPYYGQTKDNGFRKSHHLLKDYPEFKIE